MAKPISNPLKPEVKTETEALAKPRVPKLPTHIQAYNLLREELAGQGNFPEWDNLDSLTRNLFTDAATLSARATARLSRYQEIVETLL